MWIVFPIFLILCYFFLFLLLSRIIENPCTSNNAIQNPLAFGPYNYPSDFTSNETSSPASQNDSKINIHMDIPAGKLNLFFSFSNKLKDLIFLWHNEWWGGKKFQRSFFLASSVQLKFKFDANCYYHSLCISFHVQTFWHIFSSFFFSFSAFEILQLLLPHFHPRGKFRAYLKHTKNWNEEREWKLEELTIIFVFFIGMKKRWIRVFKQFDSPFSLSTWHRFHFILYSDFKCWTS